MKNLLLPVIGMLALASCAQNPSKTADKPVMDIFTATDNGITFRDTVFIAKGGMVIPRDFSQPKVRIDSTTEEASTAHFTPAADKRMSFDTTHGAVYVCNLHKRKDFAQFSLIYNLHTDVATVMLNLLGPASGTGIFKSTPGISVTDSTKRNITDLQPCSSFTNYFSGGQQYNVDSAEVNITKAGGNTIEATYKLWLANKGSTRIVTGTISYNGARIDEDRR